MLTGATVAQDSSAAALKLNSEAVVDLSRGDYRSAIAKLEEAARVGPRLAVIYFNLGSAYYYLNRYGDARKNLKKAVEITPDYAAAYNQLGAVEMEHGDHAAAMADLSQAIKLDPQFASAHYNLGCLYIRKNDFASAIKALEQARRLKPLNIEINYNIAFAYGRSGRYPDAIEAVRDVLDLTPDDSDARTMLITLLLLAADRNSAIAELHKLEIAGIQPEQWLRKMVYGKQVVSVEDLALRAIVRRKDH
jgi:tetratricopeptide (TPR) repeat protein